VSKFTEAVCLYMLLASIFSYFNPQKSYCQKTHFKPFCIQYSQQFNHIWTSSWIAMQNIG